MGDKFAPKADDNVKKVHELHLQLLAEQKAENKKVREAKAKQAAHTPAPPPEHDEKKVQPDAQPVTPPEHNQAPEGGPK